MPPPKRTVEIFFLRLRIALLRRSKFALLSPERSRSRSDPSHPVPRLRVVARPNATATGAVERSPDSYCLYVDFGSRMRRKVRANSLILNHFEHDCTRFSLVFGTATDVMEPGCWPRTPAREAYTPFRDVQANPRICHNLNRCKRIADHATRTTRVSVEPGDGSSRYSTSHRFGKSKPHISLRPARHVKFVPFCASRPSALP